VSQLERRGVRSFAPPSVLPLDGGETAFDSMVDTIILDKKRPTKACHNHNHGGGVALPSIGLFNATSGLGIHRVGKRRDGAGLGGGGIGSMIR